MKIFFFITKSEQGGAQTHVAQLAEFFVSRGDTVAIMSAPGGWLEEEARRIGAEFFSNPSLKNTANLWRLLTSGKRFLQAVHQFKPDLVACHSTIAGFIGRLSLRQKIPVIFTAHGWGFTQGAPFARRLTLPFLENLAGRYTNKIICVSQNDVNLARQKRIAPKEKITLIHNGVAIPSSPIQKRNHERVRIIFVGRLAAPKEPKRLLEAFASLPQNIRDQAEVEIIGSGPCTTVLVQWYSQHEEIKHQISLLGDVPHDQVVSHLKNADLFVLPTRWEGFPYTILEAMACGLPVIATNVGGISEAVDESGILIRKKDTQALAKALETLIVNPILRDELGKKGFERVQKKFSLDEMCRKTLHVYESVLKSP